MDQAFQLESAIDHKRPQEEDDVMVQTTMVNLEVDLTSFTLYPFQWIRLWWPSEVEV